SQAVKAFHARQQVPFRALERMAQALDLDEQALGTPAAQADDSLGVRLRELKGGDATTFSQAVVLGLAEAAWVIRKQIELGRALKEFDKSHLGNFGFKPHLDYGSFHNPAWLIGYDLAHQTRRYLGLAEDDPIESLKELIERRLFIPVVQQDLPEKFAGATVASGGSRGIVVNLQGNNQNVWVRRMTLAHELAHLLWDPDSRLRSLIVDKYTDVLSRYKRDARDYVEMRANGFAVEFLAPQAAIRRVVDSAENDADAIRLVMTTFGISKTAALYHVANAFNRTKEFSGQISSEPEVDWAGREELAVSYFEPRSVPLSRRGHFAAYVVRAMENSLISGDTASTLLGCEPTDLPIATRFVKQLIA
ncbi:MAG: ImmA/IrrE family metallo-endopeptidase, partial [Fimbriimonadaceae bacterium]